MSTSRKTGADITVNNTEEYLEDEIFSPPLQMAIHVLGERISWDKETDLFMDGRPAGARQIITAALPILKAKGEHKITYPGVCSIPERDIPGMIINQPAF